MYLNLDVRFTCVLFFGSTITGGRPLCFVFSLLFFGRIFLYARKRTRYVAFSIDQDLPMERMYDARWRTRVYSRGITRRGRSRSSWG